MTKQLEIFIKVLTLCKLLLNFLVRHVLEVYGLQLLHLLVHFLDGHAVLLVFDLTPFHLILDLVDGLAVNGRHLLEVELI